MSAHNAGGAIVKLEAPDEGDNIWSVEQIETSPHLPPGDIQGRHEIDWSFGPVSYKGYIDTNTYEIGVSPSIGGLQTGNIFGNLKDGVGLNLNLNYYKGQTRFYLKNGNELWTHIDVKVTFNGHYEGDYKIFSF
ncbi:hypothetical protein FGRMN_175 [Fusarium graminum]|nr:hypothetical protein FGRMN_175 [Fusarium graminum]